MLHCYPSDLKVGSGELMELLRNLDVRLIDMGHTHYNEIANDGWTLYSATRSTVQIEEGPAGYSVTNLDGDVVSWRFVELGTLPVVMIISPSDERLLTKTSESVEGNLKVRAKFCGESEAVRLNTRFDGHDVSMQRVGKSQVWEAHVSALHEGMYRLVVEAEDKLGKAATDAIRLVIGDNAEQERVGRDQDNALGAWPEHGLLGTKLGPNKNGKKW